jgi:hypothetical protein
MARGLKMESMRPPHLRVVYLAACLPADSPVDGATSRRFPAWGVGSSTKAHPAHLLACLGRNDRKKA